MARDDVTKKKGVSPRPAASASGIPGGVRPSRPRRATWPSLGRNCRCVALKSEMTLDVEGVADADVCATPGEETIFMT